MAIHLQLDANQEHQLDAIAAVVDAVGHVDPKGGGSDGLFGANANPPLVSDDELLANVRAIQERSGLPVSSSLELIEGEIETSDGVVAHRFPNFTVEMETGTGKTYVYLRTMLELARVASLRKFVVVVPSVAVREAVMKSVEIAADHLHDLYPDVPFRAYQYSSDNLSRLRQFALSDSVEILVMTLDSFNKAGNVIRQTTDRLMGEVPIQLLQSVRPILVLDEPQNMESELSLKALLSLAPLAALRYSATHRRSYNVLYRLTPAEAYKRGLVKRVEIAETLHADDANRAFVRLEGISVSGRTFSAKVTFLRAHSAGGIKEATARLRPGDSMRVKSGLADYEGYVVDEIDAGSGAVRFENGVEIAVGDSVGSDRTDIFRAQIRYAVEEHFRKQRRLLPLGVKVLTLFFVDKVANYTGENPVVRTLFDEAFEATKQAFAEWTPRDAGSSQAAYFAEKQQREESVAVDTTSGESKEDEAAYALIMRDKERLLSLDEPVAFIFSHSALREGWDNPNVFQICTLNQTRSDLRKRQEIGRGMRLPVNQDGARINDDAVNVLTVVANESYQRYVQDLQKEIEDEFGSDGVPPAPGNARKRGVAALREQQVLRPEFTELWDRIKHRTRYRVTVNTDALVSDAAALLAKEEIARPRITVRKAAVSIDDSGRFAAVAMTRTRTAADLSGRSSPVPLVSLVRAAMERTRPRLMVTTRTIARVILESGKADQEAVNPQALASAAARSIRTALLSQLEAGIRYEKLGEWYEMTQFDSHVESWEQYLVKADRSIYDHVAVDSAVERRFVERLEDRADVRVYVKLPRWFTVTTPVGEYNPDWAIVMENRDEHGDIVGDTLYLVRETKSSVDPTKLRHDEGRKIVFAKKHFGDALDVDFRVVTSADELP